MEALMYKVPDCLARRAAASCGGGDGGRKPSIFISVYRFIGVWQQESGKGPRLANGAACYVPNLTSHAPPICRRDSVCNFDWIVQMPTPG